MAAALELQDLSVQFHTGKEIVQAVRGVSLDVVRACFVRA